MLQEHSSAKRRAMSRSGGPVGERTKQKAYEDHAGERGGASLLELVDRWPAGQAVFAAIAAVSQLAVSQKIAATMIAAAARGAVQGNAGGIASKDDEKSRPVVAQEMVLHVLGVKKLSQALDLLRRNGEIDLAKRVARLSKAFLAGKRKERDEIDGCHVDAAAEHFDIASNAGDSLERKERWADMFCPSGNASEVESKTQLADMGDNSSDGDGVLDDTQSSGADTVLEVALQRECCEVRNVTTLFGCTSNSRVEHGGATFRWAPKPCFDLDLDITAEDLEEGAEEIASFCDEFEKLVQSRGPATKQLIRQLVASTAGRLGMQPKELLAYVTEVYMPSKLEDQIEHVAKT